MFWAASYVNLLLLLFAPAFLSKNDTRSRAIAVEPLLLTAVSRSVRPDDHSHHHSATSSTRLSPQVPSHPRPNDPSTGSDITEQTSMLTQICFEDGVLIVMPTEKHTLFWPDFLHSERHTANKATIGSLVGSSGRISHACSVANL